MKLYYSLVQFSSPESFYVSNIIDFKTMKYLWTYEFDQENAEEISGRNRELDRAIEKYPDRYPKLHTAYMTGLCSGFRIVEAENEEQLTQLVMFYYPLERWDIKPIFEGKSVSQVWRKKLVSRVDY